jgi:hypothetical protein
VQNYADADARERHSRGDAERAADRVTAEVHRLLHRTLITPLDREQIHGLIDAMDDVLDLLQGSSEVMQPYDLQKLPEDVLRLSQISVRCCSRVQYVVSLLPRLRDAAVAESALQMCEGIDVLESDADRVMRSAMSRLFREEPNTRELIKLKAVYEHLESISDRCEDVANLIERVVLESS